MDRIRALLEPLIVAEGVVDLPPEEAKPAAIARLGRLACEAVGIAPKDVDGVLKALWARELVFSTGIGLGIAVPHVRSAKVPADVIRVGRSRSGLAFDAIDGQPVHAVFTILMPPGHHRRHVEVLGAIATTLKDSGRRAAVFSAPDAAAFVQRLLGT